MNLYICDRKACTVCHPEDCMLTANIMHAKNFMNTCGNIVEVPHFDAIGEIIRRLQVKKSNAEEWEYLTADQAYNEAIDIIVDVMKKSGVSEYNDYIDERNLTK